MGIIATCMGDQGTYLVPFWWCMYLLWLKTQPPKHRNLRKFRGEGNEETDEGGVGRFFGAGAVVIGVEVAVYPTNVEMPMSICNV